MQVTMEDSVMPQKILVVGGVALGPKAACRCKRLMPDADVTIVDENVFISYGGCGIPYYMSGEINNVDDLRSTPYHTIRDPKFFQEMKDVKVRTQTRALAIDRKAKTLLVRDVVTGKEETLPYDKLVLGTGARARMPDMEGKDLQGIYAVTRLEAAQAVRSSCESGRVNKAVVVGGGFIGLEAAVALADMWGVEVTVVELAPAILGTVLPESMSLMAQHDLEAHGVTVYTGERVVRMEGKNGAVCRVVTDKRELDADLVLYAAGFIPNSTLARDAGLEVAPFGGIVVDAFMRTSDPDIYAGGDCVALRNMITGTLGYLPLGSMANRQGRVIGTNLAGGQARFKGYVGTWAVKLFDMSFCGTGLTSFTARRAGLDAQGVAIEQLDRAHFYPEKHMMSLELVVEKGTGRVLGAQGACEAGDALKARIDAVAAALQLGQPTVEDISNLEVSYAPPFASAMDVVNAAANVADNVLAGRMTPLAPEAFLHLWDKRAENNVFFMDTRPAAAGQAVQEKFPEWHAFPLEELAGRVQEVPRDRQVALVCNTGLRAYDARLILAKHGINNVVNVLGGMQAIKKQGRDVK